MPLPKKHKHLSIFLCFFFLSILIHHSFGSVIFVFILVVLFLVHSSFKMPKINLQRGNTLTHKMRKRRVLHVHSLPLVNDITCILCGVSFYQNSAKTVQNRRSSVYLCVSYSLFLRIFCHFFFLSCSFILTIRNRN